MPTIVIKDAQTGEVTEREMTAEEIEATQIPIEEERALMVCSRFQAKAALQAAGLLASVEAVIAQADPFVQLAWSEAVEFRRTSPTIAALQSAVGLTDAQIDDLFRAGMGIEA